jgi:phage tail-like protein
VTGDPFSALDFRVEIRLPGEPEPLCDAAFAHCEGLELRLDVEALREGGENARRRLLAGGYSYGEVTLRRGMTASFDLWDWAAAVARDPSLRADALVVMLARDGATEQARFALSRCLPVRLRAPRLDAAGGAIAIEELRLACEAIELEHPGRRPQRPRLEKAVFEDLEEHRRFVVQFNPRSLRRERAGDLATLALELRFDAPANSDVQQLTRPLAEFLPRRAVRFEWGSFAFVGRIVALAEEFDLFAPDGRPLRATVRLTLEWDGGVPDDRR